MSLESLLQSEPPVTLLRQAEPGRVDAAGLPLHSLVTLSTGVLGRLVFLNGGQRAMWASLGVECEYEFFTQSSAVQNGHFIRSADGRLFRVVGTNRRVYRKGGINSYRKYPLQEVSRT